MADECELERGIRCLGLLFACPESMDDLDRLPHHLAGLARDVGLDTLREDFRRLFVNAVPKVLVPPNAGAYLEGPASAQATERLKQMYLKYGVDGRDMPDHFEAEGFFLGVLRTLAEDDPDARKDYVELLRHLRAWTGRFLESVEQQLHSAFYREAARFARRVLNDAVREAETARWWEG